MWYSTEGKTTFRKPPTMLILRMPSFTVGCGHYSCFPAWWWRICECSVLTVLVDISPLFPHSGLRGTSPASVSCCPSQTSNTLLVVMRYVSLGIITGKGISCNESEMQVMVWRDDSAVKLERMSYCSGGPGFGSQYPSGGSQLSVTSVCGDPVPLLTTMDTCTHAQCKYTHLGTNTYT